MVSTVVHAVSGFSCAASSSKADFLLLSLPNEPVVGSQNRRSQRCVKWLMFPKWAKLQLGNFQKDEQRLHMPLSYAGLFTRVYTMLHSTGIMVTRTICTLQWQCML